MALAESEEEESQLLADHLSDSFKETKQMLEKMVTEQGLDWDAIVEEAKNCPVEEPELSPSQKELERLAYHYPDLVEKWLSQNSSSFDLEEITTKLLVHRDDLEVHSMKIIAAFETIRWFMWFLAPKVDRAIRGKLDPWTEDDPIQNDSNGSAKIALISIDKSMAAWETLRAIFPETEDDMLDLLAVLVKLRKGLEEAFPNAEAFLRPGFDEPKYFQGFK